MDKESVITKDRLQKFNEIQGTAAGTQDDQVEPVEVAFVDENGDDINERADEVADLGEGAGAGLTLEEEKDEVRSLAARSQVSKAVSKKSNATSKTYISKLELQLE